MMWVCKIRFILITILHTCFIALEGIYTIIDLSTIYLFRKKIDKLCVLFSVISPSYSR